MNSLANDSLTLILASYALAMVAVFIISMLVFDRAIRAKYPRLLDTALWCLACAVALAVMEALCST